MKKKFVIVGATGAVGSSLTKLIKKKNLEAHLIAKNKDEVESLNQETGFSYTVADVLQEDYLDKVRKSGSSAGAIIKLKASGLPAGIGSPIYSKLDSEIAAGIMSINAVKGVEIGSGFDLVEIEGINASDEMRTDNQNNVSFSSNHSGGILGGISSGQDIDVKFVVKPTSSILSSKNSVDADGNNIEIKTKGRHDPCVGIRAVPVGEAMLVFTLADLFLAHRAQVGNINQ